MIFAHIRSLILGLAISVISLSNIGMASAAVERRVALVIGNGGYRHTDVLPNATKDSAAIAAKLTELGFLVIDGTDLTQSGMTDRLKEFSRALVGADVAMFFYAGHGMQIGGENYLVPIDASLKSERDVDFETLKVDLVLRQMQEAKVKVVILDACRDNPLAAELTRSMNVSGRSRSVAPAAGLGAVDAQSAQGSLIAFATAPGSVALDGPKGEHSPFTAALLNHVGTPGIDVDVMMKRVRGDVARSTSDKQRPWTSSSLNSEFYLNPTQVASASNAATGSSSASAAVNDASSPRALSPGAFDPRQIEFQLWQDAKTTNTAQSYKSYLAQFPSGIFADLARQNVARLSGATGVVVASAPTAGGPSPVSPQDLKAALASASTEDALGLDEEGWKLVQQKLTAQGFGTRGVDGSVGEGTRRALRDWQASAGLTSSGFLNRLQYEALVGAAPVKRVTTSASGDTREQKTRRAARSSDSDEPRAGKPARREAPANSNSSASDAAASALVGGIIGGVLGGAIGRKW